MTIYPFLFGSVAFFENLDPFYFISRELMSPELFKQSYVKFILISSKGSICLVISIFACGLTCLLLVVLMVSSRSALGYQNAIANLKCVEKFIHLSKSMMCLYRVVDGVIEYMAGLLMLFGLFYFTAVNFITLKGHGIIPVPLYYMFPSVNILIPFLINNTLLPAISIGDRAEESLRKWKVKVKASNGTNNYRLAKQIRGMLPLRISVGIFNYRFYVIRMSTFKTYYNKINEFTFHALLSIHL